MASPYSVARAKHATIAVANTAEQVTLTDLATKRGEVEVVNRDGVAAIYFTVDGSTPTVGGDDTYVLPAAIGSFTVRSPANVAAVVKLVSAGTPQYSVQGEVL